MSRPVIVTCAVSGGSHEIALKNPAVPVTPEEIADECIAAAREGAAVAHIHVRNPQTRAGSMDIRHYREVVRRIADSDIDIIVNLTTGPGAMFVPSADNPRIGDDLVTNLATPEARVAHILELRPEICSIDVVSFNHGRKVFMNTVDHVDRMAEMVKAVGTKPELEAFEVGNVLQAADLIKRGRVEGPGLFQFCLGIPWGAPATVEAMHFMRSHLPPGAIWAGFGVGARAFPMVAASVLLGGHVRVGLEDNIYMSRGQLANGNAPLVRRAVDIIKNLGDTPATPQQARKILNLK